MQPKAFTIESVKAIFLHLSEQYPAEDLLEVDALSNDRQVAQAGYWFAGIESFRFGNVPPLIRDHSPNEPLSATYYRTDGSESFAYYPAAGTGKPISVELQGPGAGCGASGNTAVDLLDASRRGCKDVVKKLLDDGADPNVKTSRGGAALVEAAGRGLEDIVKLLLKRGADINQTSSSGWTALVAAVTWDRPSLINLLLRGGADPNISTEDGRTALIVAVIKENVAVVNELLARGADVTMIDGYGKTALAIAEEKQNAELIRLLKKAGAGR